MCSTLLLLGILLVLANTVPLSDHGNKALFCYSLACRRAKWCLLQDGITQARSQRTSYTTLHPSLWLVHSFLLLNNVLWVLVRILCDCLLMRVEHWAIFPQLQYRPQQQILPPGVTQSPVEHMTPISRWRAQSMYKSLMAVEMIVMNVSLKLV